MTCKEVIEFLADYLDGSLPLRQRLVFHLHLMFCRHCRRYLKSYADTVRLSRALRHQLPSEIEPAPEKLVQAILAARRSGD